MKIKASVIGAKLKIENTTIAYGSENSISICFGFANEWADYTQRRAYFRYGQSQSYYVDIDENGNVEIPSIVIAPPRFSVFVQGKTDDGTKIIRTDLSTINVVGNLNAEALPVDGDGTSTKILPLKKITQNGTYSANDDLVDGYGKVVVDINTYPLEVTKNGEYTPKESCFFDKVSVNISSYPFTITKIGTYYPEDGYLFDSVTLPDIPLTNAFTSIGYDSIPEVFNEWIEYSKELASKWNPSSTSVDLFAQDMKLVLAPKIDTSNVIDMNNMFANCYVLSSVPAFDTSNVTNMSYMFHNCASLTTIPQLDTSNVTDMSYMFDNCASLTTIPQLDTSNVTDMSGMFDSCGNLTTIPQLDTSNVTNMVRMFYGCVNLTTILQLDTSNVTSMVGMFDSCVNLTSILMTGTKCSFDIQSTNLQHDALVILLNNLGTANSNATLTMGSSKLALLSDEEKKIATDKGWTLA